MNHRLPLAVAAVAVCAGSALLWISLHSKAPEPTRPQSSLKKTSSAEAKKLLAQMPVWFEALPDGRFTSQSVGRSVTFAQQSASWKLKGGAHVAMKFQNANPSPVKHGVSKLAARFDRYKGNDRSKWQLDVPAFEKVAYDKIYPGVDLVFYGQGQKMEHDFIVAPHADPKQIRLAFEGASKIELDKQGNLNLTAGSEQLAMSKPVAYQTLANGERAPVSASFVKAADDSIAFELGQYDASLPLVIDPIFSYASYYGGNGEDEFVSVAVDLKSNSVWMVGSTDSTDFTTNNNGTLNGSFPSGGRDVFIAQFVNADIGRLTISYSSVYGGTGSEEPTSMAIAPNGKIYVVGSTASVDLPTVGAYSTTFQGASDAFIMGLDPTLIQSGGAALIYSTFLGGTATDNATAITTDSKSLLYVAGYTLSTDFPTSSGAILAGNRGGYDPWVAKIDASAGSSGLLYSTTYGGSLTDEATGVAVDAQGVIYMTGWTYSLDFPASGDVPQYNYIGQGDIFLVGIDPRKNGADGIVFATYLGGGGFDKPTAMSFAPNGLLYIAGYTLSTDFPIAGNAIQRRNAGQADMFLMGIDFRQRPSQWVVYSTYLGGSGDDIPFSMAIDPQGLISLAGYTHPLSAIPNPTAKAFPTTANAIQPNSQGLEEGVLVRINPALPAEQALTFSTFWGGPLNDIGIGVAADPRGCFLYTVGSTNSPGLQVVSYAFQTDLATGPDAFILGVDTCSSNPPTPESRRTPATPGN